MSIFGSFLSNSAPVGATPEIAMHEDRLRKVDQRLSEIETELTRVPTHGPAHAELLQEQQDLATIRRTTDLKIRMMLAPPSERELKAKARRDALVARRENELRDGWLRQAERFALEGDHRQARLMRMNALDAKSYAEREFPP